MVVQADHRHHCLRCRPTSPCNNCCNACSSSCCSRSMITIQTPPSDDDGFTYLHRLQLRMLVPATTAAVVTTHTETTTTTTFELHGNEHRIDVMEVRGKHNDHKYEDNHDDDDYAWATPYTIDQRRIWRTPPDIYFEEQCRATFVDVRQVYRGWFQLFLWLCIDLHSSQAMICTMGPLSVCSCVMANRMCGNIYVDV